MTKADIVEDIAQKTGLTKKEVAETVDLFLEKIGNLLIEGRHLEIRGFGTFKVKDDELTMEFTMGFDFDGDGFPESYTVILEYVRENRFR